MNIQQKKYLIKRADQIESDKMREVSEKYNDMSLPNVINVNIKNPELLVERIKTHLSKTDKYEYCYSDYRKCSIDLLTLTDCLNVESITEHFKQSEKIQQNYRNEEREILAQIRKDFSKAKDIIMLGDDKEALRILEELTNKDYTK